MRLHGVAELVERLAPAALAAEWDNSGWQIRLEDGPLSSILVALDATPETIAEAAEGDAQLLITHHPMFLRSPRSVAVDELVGATAVSAIRAGVSVYSAHTNLDAAAGGTSWALAEALDLRAGRVLEPRADADSGYGVVVRAERPRTLRGWSKLVAERLDRPALSLSGDPEGKHEVLAVMGGSGAGQLGLARSAGATLYLTADIRYHEAQQARASGLSLVVLDHYASERPVLDRLAAFLRSHSGCNVVCSNRRTTPWEVPGP